MAADDDDLVGTLAPADLADDVGRVGVGQELGLHLQPDPDLRAAVLHALQPLGVLGRDRRRRDLRRALGVAQRAGVRRAQAGRADRADEHGDGAERGRARWSGGAVLHRLAVVRERDVEEDDLAARGGAGRVELVEGADDEHVGLDAVGGRADAVAEAEHRQRVTDAGDVISSALLAAHPVRHLDRLGAHVLEAVLLHLGRRPRDGGVEAFGSAEAVAERVAEEREPLPREGTRCDSAISRARRLAVGVEPARGLRGGCCAARATSAVTSATNGSSGELGVCGGAGMRQVFYSHGRGR